MISSKVLERWLISITDMPTPGSDNMFAPASSRTGTGITAGPALKLKIRSVINYFAVRRQFDWSATVPVAALSVLLKRRRDACAPVKAAPNLSFLSMRAQYGPRCSQNQRARHNAFHFDHDQIRPA